MRSPDFGFYTGTSRGKMMKNQSFSFEQVLNELIQLLGGELNLHRNMLKVLSKEKNALMDSRIDRFTAAGMEKKTLIINIASLEKKRLGLLGLLEIHFGLSPQTLKLGRLVELVPRFYAQQLNDCRQHLLEVAHQIKKANQSTEYLVSQALETTRESIAFITNLIKSHSTYYASGKMGENRTSGILMSNTI